MLHCLDLGVTTEVCGNAMWEALAWLDWGSRLMSARFDAMWVRLQRHYKEQNTPVQIQSLPLTAVKQNVKSPKFRARASKTGTLLCFIVDVATELHEASELH